MRLAAIKVSAGEITQRAGYATNTTITAHDDGFTIHDCAGPPPRGWFFSPASAVASFDQVPGGMRVRTTHPALTVRFVPVLPESRGDDDAPPKMPEPDWSRAQDANARRTERQALRDWTPSRGQLQARLAELEKFAEMVKRELL